MHKQKAYTILEKHYTVISFEFIVMGCTNFALKILSACTESTFIVGNYDRSKNFK